MTVVEMIERARKYAELGKKATPGPWKWQIFFGLPQWGIMDMLMAENKMILQCEEVDEPDSELIRAAPEMAELLGIMADEMERMVQYIHLLERGLSPDEARATVWNEDESESKTSP